MIHTLSLAATRRNLSSCFTLKQKAGNSINRILGLHHNQSYFCNNNNGNSSTLNLSRFKSTVVAIEEDEIVDEPKSRTFSEIQRLKHLRNVGILAHVDAGKTTVTERMLALAGVVRHAGCVDDGNTVTDFLPAERERGITIQSAAISFEWGWHNNRKGDDYEANDNVSIQLIDTPGHVDFSVEVNRSVAVLDGAVLVVDAVAGVQAQTETVWRAMTRPSLNNHEMPRTDTTPPKQDHAHEPLPCLALINKMDKDGCHFGKAIQSLRYKLPGANPIATQIPLFKGLRGGNNDDGTTIAGIDSNIVAIPPEDVSTAAGEFVGVVDLLHMRAIIWPNVSTGVSNVENCIPKVINLLQSGTHEPLNPDCQITQQALAARFEFIESLAEVDPVTEEYYLNDQEPSNAELRAALRRATLANKALPVMAAAALKGKGIEPLLDAIADLLPSPLDRIPPAVTRIDDLLESGNTKRKQKKNAQHSQQTDNNNANNSSNNKNTPATITIGHPLHPTTLALAFKVVHMKGRGGSGDGRVVFARVYSGNLKDKETVQVISPPAPGEAPEKPRVERIGGMLELAGGRFDNVEGGQCLSGDVCALVGLKSVVTGDTIIVSETGGSKNSSKKSKKKSDLVCLAGVASPKPVLTVRLEAESTQQQSQLAEALRLLVIEDPSLLVEEKDSTTLLSGLGELHIEVTLDRLRREFGLEVMTGTPFVAYRETITNEIETSGLFNYDRTIGGTRLQASVHLLLEPNFVATACSMENLNGESSISSSSSSSCMMLSDPIIHIGQQARFFLGMNQDADEEEVMQKNPVVRALIQGCKGALKRGPLNSSPMANVKCHVLNVDAEGGLAALQSLPGALQAAAAEAISCTLRDHKTNGSCTVLEPTMSVEVSLPGDMVGTVLADLTGRRGHVEDVHVGDDNVASHQPLHSKALVRGDVPLVEILGYATGLRSLTAGEGTFTAEYKGHSPCQLVKK